MNCQSGKRMKKENLIFTTEDEVIEHGYRPCGHC